MAIFRFLTIFLLLFILPGAGCSLPDRHGLGKKNHETGQEEHVKFKNSKEDQSIEEKNDYHYQKPVRYPRCRECQ